MCFFERMVEMSKLRTLFMLCCISFSVMADIEISINGTVKNEEGAAIAGATVTILSDTSLNDTTNANGEFTIRNTAISRSRIYGTLTQNSNYISIKGNQLLYTITSPVKEGVISIFSGNGKRSAEIPLGKLKSGLHKRTLPKLAAGFYIMHIIVNQSTTTYRLVNTGNEFYLSNNSTRLENVSMIYLNSATESIDTIMVKKDGFEVMKKAIASYKQTGIAILMKRKVDRPVYSYAAIVENTGCDCNVPELPDASQLPKITKLPDPFKKIDGTRMSKKSEWQCRRQEILKQAEKYIYGEKPIPELVIGTVTRTKVSVHVEDKGKAIDFSAAIVLPPNGQGPFPAIINVGTKGGFGGITLGESRILEQGVAVIYYNHYELGQEGTPEKSRGQPNPGKFYEIYGGNHSAGLLMAWAWGASRIIDVLQKSGGEIIDAERLGVTGCSRNGKGAFTIGVFDERIALTIPQETSTGGVPALRIVDKLNTERTDHNYYGLNWLSNNFEPFVFKNNVSNAVKLPIDAHSMVAMIAPRGLLVLENPHQRQMGAPAGYTSVMAGSEVYKALGAGDNISYHSNVSNTEHCSYKNEYTDLLVQNIARFLKHEGDKPGKIVAGTGGTLNISEWKDWQTPTLESDTEIYGSDLEN